MRWFAMVLALAGALAFCDCAWAADAKTLARLQAPPPMDLLPLPDGVSQKIKFARAVIQLKPEPWARVRFTPRVVNEKIVAGDDRLLTWEEGQVEVEPAIVAQIVAEELRRAKVSVDGASDSLFAQESSADLILGATITDMNAFFCQGCDGVIKIGYRWSGAVVQTARWEIYSGRERRVIATIRTDGGFTAPKRGLEGSPSQLLYGAFRDNVRRLIATEEFRRVVTADPAAPMKASGPPPMTYSRPTSAPRPIASSVSSVVAIFAGEALGTGFLISKDGYLLTNRHVVGGAKYVKVKWADGAETLGEVIRSDMKRDIALLKADVGARQPLSLRSSAPVLGEAVYAIGTPLDAKFQGSVTKGIVSASRTYEGLPYVQSDVAINHGNSGGPLLDENGAVIGVAVSGMQISGAPVGVNLFIPIDDALKALALTPVS